jgi:hypothetical protein
VSISDLSCDWLCRQAVTILMAAMLVRALSLVACLGAGFAQQDPGVYFHAPDQLELRSLFVRALFNLTAGSLDVVQG